VVGAEAGDTDHSFGVQDLHEGPWEKLLQWRVCGVGRGCLGVSSLGGLQGVGGNAPPGLAAELPSVGAWAGDLQSPCAPTPWSSSPSVSPRDTRTHGAGRRRAIALHVNAVAVESCSSLEGFSSSPASLSKQGHVCTPKVAAVISAVISVSASTFQTREGN